MPSGKRLQMNRLEHSEADGSQQGLEQAPKTQFKRLVRTSATCLRLKECE